MSPAAYIEAAATAALLAYAGTTGTPGTFLRESAVQATLSLNSDALPAIICGDFTVTTVPNAVGKDFDKAAAVIYFADAKAGAGDDPQAHQLACVRMERLQHLFFAELLRLERPASDRRRTPFSEAYEAMLDGVGCQFTLTVPAPSLVAVCLPILA